MIEVLKQALEALEYYGWHTDDCDTLECDCGYDKAITSLRQAIAKAEDNYQGSDAAKAAHMMDLYTALGVRWGDNPFAVIAKMRSIAELESQEPVCEWCDGTGMVDSGGTQPWGEAINIPCRCQHTHPPQRTWVGLTDEDKKQMAKEANYHWEMTAGEYAERIGQLTEAKLKEKNS